MKKTLQITLPDFTDKQLEEIKTRMSQLTTGNKEGGLVYDEKQKAHILSEQKKIKAFMDENADFDTEIFLSNALANFFEEEKSVIIQADGVATIKLEDLPGEKPGCKKWREMCVEKDSYGACILWDTFCVH